MNKTTHKNLLTAVLGIALGASLITGYLTGRASYQAFAASPNSHNPITICHSTSSLSNPYLQQTVDDDSVFKQGHDQHHNKRDIIPPFDYYDQGQDYHYPGLNWDDRGQSIWNNLCQIPEPECEDEECEPEEEYCPWNPQLPINDPACVIPEEPCEETQTCEDPTTNVELAVDNDTCEGNTFNTRYSVKKDGQPVQGVQVTFEYMNEVKIGTTASNGEVGLDYTNHGEGTITANANGYPEQTITFVPNPDQTCDGSDSTNSTTTATGEVLGATTGQILGATTYADAGIIDQTIVNIMGFIGSVTTGLGALLKLKKLN